MLLTALIICGPNAGDKHAAPPNKLGYRNTRWRLACPPNEEPIAKFLDGHVSVRKRLSIIGLIVFAIKSTCACANGKFTSPYSKCRRRNINKSPSALGINTTIGNATTDDDDDDEEEENTIKDAISCISSNLQGVGPATASAILVRACPHKFCYMYDEVIDTFLLSKRTYTLKVYLDINNECTRLANELNKNNDSGDVGGRDWTTARVARTLWIAARVLAAGDGEDLTSKSKAASTAAAAAAATSSDRKKRTAAAAAAVGTTGKTSSSDTTKKRRTTKSRK